MQICDLDAADANAAVAEPAATSSAQPSPLKRTPSSEPMSRNAHTNRWTLGEVRRKLSISGTSGAGGFGGGRAPKQGLVLKVTTSKMRCSIKAKEQFENMDHGSAMYIKTAVFEHDILASAWKSDQFAPSLSVRWDARNAELRIPLASVEDLRHICVRTTIATKTKLGKKIVLGTLLMGGRTTSAPPTAAEHWANVAAGAGNAIAAWHAFE